MPRIMLIRSIHMTQGNREQAVNWIRQSAPLRQQRGQISQHIVKGITDPNDWLFIQIWDSLERYQAWKQSPERERLANERQRLLTHGPVEFYEIL